MRRIALAAAAVVAGLVPAASALASGAAPTYVTSDPQNGATVSSPPSRVSVTFSEPLDSSSTLQVFDQCGRSVDAGDAQVLGSRIDVGIAQTPAGHYTAVYVAKGFAGATGDTKGSFSFHVTSGAQCDGGGHDGHGGPGGHDGGDGGGHDGHDGDGGDGGHKGHGGGGDHGGTGSAHTDHEGSGSDGHGGGGHGGDGHGGGGHGDGGHGGEGHGGKGDRHDRHPGSTGPGGGDAPELASGRGGLGLAPTSTSVLIALALSIGMGAVGGWVLRVSAGS